MNAGRTSRRAWPLLVLLACVLTTGTGCEVGLGGTTNNNNGNCNAAGAGNSVDCSGVPAGSASTAVGAANAPATTAAPAAPDGKQLSSYLITLPAGYHIPIGPQRPTAAQITADGPGDLIFNVFSGTYGFLPMSPYSEIAPYDGDPSYQGCLNDTNKQSYVGVGGGTAFCLFEQNLVVGGVVTYLDPHAINPDSVTVQFTVWSNAS